MENQIEEEKESLTLLERLRNLEKKDQVNYFNLE